MLMHAKSLIVPGLVVLIVSTFGNELKAQDINPKGKPSAYRVGSGKYAIWYDSQGWHFRATAAKDGQAFTGHIDAVDGQFKAMRPVSTTAKGPRRSPGQMLKIKSKGFQVKFTLLKGSESGFDLQLDNAATGIKFTLQVDGKDEPKLILIGAKGAHPAAAEFTLPAKPGKK